MRQRKTFTLLALVVAVMLLGVAYAAIQNVTLSVAGNVTASPDQGNFKIGFTGKYTFTGEPVETRASGDEIDGFVYDDWEREGIFTSNYGTYYGTYVFMYIDNLSVKGDKGTMKFEIKNGSTDISAILATTVRISDEELTYTFGEDYFDIDCSIETDILGPGQTTWLTITAELIKTPITEDVQVRADVQLTASPTQAKEISFTISGDRDINGTYYALEGMTWEEWIDSEYNTIKGFIYDGEVYCSNSDEDQLKICDGPDYDNDGVSPSDYISDGYAYEAQ